jgi:hypothetical protein
MEKNITKEIKKIKTELYQTKEKIRDIKKLINEEIDSELTSDLSDFSERELETQLGEFLSFLNKPVDPLPDKASITSHRKIIGKPIVWIKRILLKISWVYLSFVSEKQKSINQKYRDLFKTLIYHQKMFRKKINLIEKRISECEVELVIISKKIKKNDSNSMQPENNPSIRKPDEKNK